jgi:hypothetical protein
MIKTSFSVVRTEKLVFLYAKAGDRKVASTRKMQYLSVEGFGKIFTAER